MGRFTILMSAGILALSLTACGDVIEVAQTRADADKITAQAQAAQGEAQRLAAETTRAQAEAQRESVKALIDAQNARVDDYRAILIMALVLAAGSMGLSLAMALIMRSTNRQPPQIYQIGPAPQPTLPPAPAQIGQLDDWPEIRARQRAVAELQAGNYQRYTI